MNVRFPGEERFFLVLFVRCFFVCFLFCFVFVLSCFVLFCFFGGVAFFFSSSVSFLLHRF